MSTVEFAINSVPLSSHVRRTLALTALVVVLVMFALYQQLPRPELPAPSPANNPSATIPVAVTGSEPSTSTPGSVPSTPIPEVILGAGIRAGRVIYREPSVSQTRRAIEQLRKLRSSMESLAASGQLQSTVREEFAQTIETIGQLILEEMEAERLASTAPATERGTTQKGTTLSFNTPEQSITAAAVSPASTISPVSSSLARESASSIALPAAAPTTSTKEFLIYVGLVATPVFGALTVLLAYRRDRRESLAREATISEASAEGDTPSDATNMAH